MKSILLGASVAIASLAVYAIAEARTLRYSMQDDATTLDPHAANLLGVGRITRNVYEPLVARDRDFRIVPGLALSWSQPDATTWRFKLRPNVKFHDASPLTADDVVFSVERAMHPLSQLKSSVQGIGSARKVDDLTVDLVMKEPNPVLLNHLFNLLIMSKAWSAKNGALLPQNYKDKEDTFASRNTNGTGPFMVTVRQPDVKTVLVENPHWWNRASPERGNVTEVVVSPIKAAGTRLAALLSAEVDFVIDPPLQDVGRLKAAPELRVVQGGEPRVQFIGFDVNRDELLYGSVKGKNPFKDLRVRQAIAHAIDVESIRTKIYRGLMVPSGSIVATQVQGYAKDTDKRLAFDRERAKKLLAEAGYPNGFEVTVDCSNAPPSSDACQAFAPMLAQIGIKLTPNLLVPTNFFPKIQKFDTSMFFYSWGSTTFDSLYVLQSLVYTNSGDQTGNGDSNLGRYSNPRVDRLIDQVKVEPDMKKRDALIREVLAIVAAELPVVPVHQPINSWAMRKNVSTVFSPNNVPNFFRVRVD
jgi:peptide/nickel transport system substrate-binding protein